MGSNRFVLGRTYIAALSSLPSIIIFVLFTEEVSQLIDKLSLSVQASTPLIYFSLASFITLTFIGAFLLNLHYLRKKSYSFLAATHVFVQLIIVTICVFIVSQTANIANPAVFLLSGFLLSVIISEVSFLLSYHKIKPKHFIEIEELLRKRSNDDDDRKPSFLREGGFLWIDFKKGMNTQRKETKEIMNEIKNKNSVIFLGDQASGKSNIIRDVGYQLANRGFVVFFTNADWLDVNLAAVDVRNWDMSNVIIIIDDIHRNLMPVADFLEKMYSHNVRFVLSSRPTLDYNLLKERNCRYLLHLINKRIDVKVTDETIYEIITKYATFQLGINYALSKRNMEGVIQKCGTDLWILTYFLPSLGSKAK